MLVVFIELEDLIESLSIDYICGCCGACRMWMGMLDESAIGGGGGRTSVSGFGISTDADG